MNIDEVVHLEEYNPDWPIRYEIEKDRLCAVLGNNIIGIEHIGSTSIPGIWAKPIIDILIGVKSIPLRESQISRVINIGYEYLGEAGVKDRFYLRKRSPKEYNVHITQIGDSIWNNNILFRDYLRDDESEAKLYSDLKRMLMSEGINTLLEYSDKKNSFISDLLIKANDWKKTKTQ